MKRTMIFPISIIFIMIFLFALAACNNNKKSKKSDIPADTINLHIGDKLFVEVTKGTNHKANLKIVNAIKDSAITLKISFTYQLMQGNVGYCTVLHIYNPTPETIVCNSSMKKAMKSITPEHTCSIWSFKIENIILTEFRFE